MINVKETSPTSTEVEQRVEGPLEKQTTNIPPELFFWAAGGSILASLSLKLLKKDHASLFVGQWAPTFLILGVYGKMVQTSSSR